MRNLFVFLFASAFLISCDSKNSGGSSGNDYAKIKENNQAVLNAMEKGDWATIDKYIDANAVDHAGTTGELKGLEAIKKDMMVVKAAYPNMKFEVLGTAMDGDLFYSWARVIGTQSGPFMGMPATNKSDTMTSVDVIRIKDGKMTEHWAFMDMAQAMKNMPATGTGEMPHDMGNMSDTSKMKSDSSR